MILLGVPAYPAIRAIGARRKSALHVGLYWCDLGRFDRLGVLTDFEVRQHGVNIVHSVNVASPRAPPGAVRLHA